MAILFVRILTIFLQRKSSSILTKEASPPVITVASLVTLDPNVHSSKLRRRRLRGSCLLRPHQVLYLRRDIKFHGISGNNNGLFWRTNQGTTRKSRKSPIATMPMKGCWKLKLTSKINSKFVHKVSTKIIMQKLNDTEIFVDEVKTQLREKPLQGSQT
jgi:hypothetical protein